jgi:hypothetical protein
MRDCRIELTLRERHQAQQVQRIGMTRPDDQHLAAELASLIRTTGVPVGMGMADGFCNGQDCLVG